MPLFVVMMSADVKNAESGHYSKMGKKRRAGSLQLNGQRKSEPTHINMKKAKVSSSLSVDPKSTFYKLPILTYKISISKVFNVETSQIKN